VDSFASFWGCDSIVTTEVILQPVYDQTINAGICDGGSYTLPDGSIVTTAGTYTNTLQSIFGCDSIITTVLVISTGFEYSVDIELCDGDSYLLPNGETETHAGTYVDTLLTSLGCDSIITTNISLLPHSSSEIDQFVCDADFYILASGDTVIEEGIYLYTIDNYYGCDSTIHANVIFSQSVDTFIQADICDGSPYVLPSGDTVYSTGIFTDSLFTIAGCDSVITVDLTVHPVYIVHQADTICDGESYTLPDGQTISTGGQYTNVFSTAFGCDSVIITDLVALPSYYIVNNYEICPGDSVMLPNGDVV
jgi:hypothetical protein